MFADAVLLIRIVTFASFVPLLLRLPIRRVEKIVEPRDLAGPADPDQVQRIIRFTDLFCYTFRRFIKRSCLIRGLTLYYFLRRAGVDSSLVFGVGNDFQEFAGHCWLVRNGEPYLEKTDPRPFFTQIHTFNAPQVEYRSSESTCVAGE